MGDPNGFSWTRRRSGEVIIEHDGRRAAVFRGRAAEKFLDDVSLGNEQELMARAAGELQTRERTRQSEPSTKSLNRTYAPLGTLRLGRSIDPSMSVKR